MTVLILVVFGELLGALAGSLIHAVAGRLPSELSPLGPPVCSECSRQLPSTYLIPGWTGSCPACRNRNHWHKWATEIAAAGLTAASLVIHGLTLMGLTVTVFSLLLLLILRIDWQRHLIFTVTIVPGILLALMLAALRSSEALVSALVAAGASGFVFGLFFLLALLIYRQQALGFGDVLLAILIGAMTGVSQVLPSIFLGMVLAAFGGLFLIVIGRRKRNDYIPYGAYLCAGTIIVLLVA